MRISLDTTINNPLQSLAYALGVSLIVHVLMLAAWPQELWPSSHRLALQRLSVSLADPPRQAVAIAKSHPAAPPAPSSTATRPSRGATAAMAKPAESSVENPTVTIPPATRIDFDTARQAAREYARESAANTAPERRNLAPAQVDQAPDALARTITRATAANCREKYAGAGLLGIPLLLKDSISDGCVW